MPTPAERKALIFLAGIALLGAGARVVSAVHATPPLDASDSAALARQRAAVESATVEGGLKRGGRRGGGQRRGSSQPASDVAVGGEAPTPKRGRATARTTERAVVDLDRATAAEIERLPRVGPVLAGRIVADRDSLGAFGSLGGFRRVRGVGCGMLRVLAPHVTFSLTPRQSAVNDRGPPAPRAAACAPVAPP